jgi:hypothetical protein
MLLHLLLASALSASAAPAVKAPPEPAPSVLPGERKACELPGGLKFTYRFASRPQLGTMVLKLQVFGPDGKPDTSLKVTGSSGMPDMKGAHDSGEKPFQLNRKGDYLLPLDVVMPGDWEVLLSFFKAGRRIYRGKIGFSL